MTKEILPCPFCGGEASKRLFYKGKYRVHCNACDAHSGDVCDTEAEAIQAWNTRAERTCKRVSSAIEVGEVNGHKIAIPQYRCGECNRWLSDADKYCPNCGAKVIGG